VFLDDFEELLFALDAVAADFAEAGGDDDDVFDGFLGEFFEGGRDELIWEQDGGDIDVAGEVGDVMIAGQVFDGVGVGIDRVYVAGEAHGGKRG